VRDLLDKEHAVRFAGWDWASASHAITIIDAAGRVVDRATLTHTEAELDAALSRLAAHAPPPTCPWRSRPQAGWWSTGCWPPGTP